MDGVNGTGVLRMVSVRRGCPEGRFLCVSKD